MAKNQPIKYMHKDKSMEAKDSRKVPQFPLENRLLKSNIIQIKKNTAETIAVKAVNDKNGPLFKENDTPPIEEKIMNKYRIKDKIIRKYDKALNVE